MAEGRGSSMFQAGQKRYRQVQIIEEEISEEKKSPLCESCVKEGPPEEAIQIVRVSRFERELRCEPEGWLVERVAVFLCFDCEMYVCVNCLPGHESHEGVRVGKKESEREEREMSESMRMEEHSSSERMKNKGKVLGKKTKRMRLEEGNEKEEEKREKERMEEESERESRLLLDGLMRESETERIEKFERSHVGIYDRVYVQHELDRGCSCWITGLCVLENQRWVVCDSHNSCIQIFTLGSNVLQRYVRFVGSEPRPQDSTSVRYVGSAPCDVTEILVDQNSTEPNLASGSSSGVSVTDQAEQGKQCLIAVTLPMKFQIMFIDLSKKPALINKVIHTGRICRSIQFYENKIFTTCRGGPYDFSWSVYIYSTDGDMLNKFNTDINSCFHGPYLAVASGRIYLPDEDKNKVQCRNFEGQLQSEITIEGSGPVGISVDPDKNVYVCARRQGIVYKLDAALTRYTLESVLDQTADSIEKPEALCYYRNKLFISHFWSPSLNNFVTVVRLL